VFEYVLLAPVADQLLGRPYLGDPARWEEAVHELGWEAAVRRRAEDQLDLALRLGHDLLYVIPNRPPPAPVPTPPAAPVLSPDPVANLVRRNDDAAQAPPLADASFLMYGALNEAMRRRGVDLPILAPAYVHGVWTDTDLMETMLLAPEVAHRHFALATTRALQLVRRYVELGIDQIGVGGDFSGTRPLISPEAYRTFIVPEVRALSRAIHAAGRQAINASDGNLWPVIEDFLFGCEVDGYLEIDLHAGMDLPRLKRAYGGGVTFYGNLDCGTTLSFGSPADVRRHVLECLDAGWGDGGHILCASNAITASVPLANYRAAVNAYRERFGLPPL
jgi:hypothetical protein